MSVRHLARHGLTPIMDTAARRLHEDLHAALDRAEQAGMPVELIVGLLECTRASVLDAYFAQVRGQQG